MCALCDLSLQISINFITQGKEHKDITYEDEKQPFKMKFLWAPLMKNLEDKLLRTVISETKATVIPNIDGETKTNVVQVDFIVIGIGLWSLQHGSLKDAGKSERLFHKFTQGLPRIIQVHQLEVRYSCARELLISLH